MFDSDSDAFTQERDRVLNAETRRALARAARLIGVAAVGVLTAAITLLFAVASAILAAPWQLHVAVTVIVALALPIAVPYAMLRVYGLAHRDVVYVAKRAYREVIAETIALSGSRTAADVFTETSESGESGESDDVGGETGGEEGSEENREESGAESDNLPSEEMDTARESSTESEPTDLHQQAEPEP